MAKQSKSERARNSKRRNKEKRRTGDMVEIGLAYWGGDFFGGHIAQRMEDEGSTTMDVAGREVDVYVGGGLVAALSQVFFPLKSNVLRAAVLGGGKAAVTSRRALAGYAERQAEIKAEKEPGGGG